ncbi:hypothetical protein LINPERHAP1_LOCUS20673 [Linum perenne]
MKVLLHAVLWYIWKERNSRIFKDSSEPPVFTFRRIGTAVGDWLRVNGSFSSQDLILWRRVIFDNG